MTATQHRSGRADVYRWTGVALGLLAASTLAWRTSSAAFSATTSNGPNSFSAGTVKLTDDDGGPPAAMFSLTNLRPGDSGSQCIQLTYSGSLAAVVRAYATDVGFDASAGNLAPYLDWRVEQGTGATSASCAGFTPNASTVQPLSLSEFEAARTSYATGFGTWAPTGTAPATQSYRVTYTLRDDNAAQGKNARVTLTWEAQNS